MATERDRWLLPLIDHALAAPGWLPPIPAPLRGDYMVERMLQCRLFNRRLIITLTLIFDAFWLAQFNSAPEIVSLSGLLRFGVMTPAVLIFVILDLRNLFGRLYGPCLLALSIAPGVITAILGVYTTSRAGLMDISATPLILLGTSMALRMPPLEVFLNAALTPSVFIASIFFCRVLPFPDLVSLSLIEISIAFAAIAFNLQLEWRDRRVFLLHTAEQIMRAELAARNRGLVRETRTDTLTGIANRRCFEDTIALVWDQALRVGMPVGLIMVDVDYFKAFNDFYGHQRGDDCLRLVTARMAVSIRENDMLARYGGEEFAIILPDTTLEAACSVGERVRAAVEGLGLLHGGLGPEAILTVSLGVASITPANAFGIRELIAEADRNLYAAKRGGRNRIGQGAAAGTREVQRER